MHKKKVRNPSLVIGRGRGVGLTNLIPASDRELQAHRRSGSFASGASAWAPPIGRIPQSSRFSREGNPSPWLECLTVLRCTLYHILHLTMHVQTVHVLIRRAVQNVLARLSALYYTIRDLPPHLRPGFLSVCEVACRTESVANLIVFLLVITSLFTRQKRI